MPMKGNRLGWIYIVRAANGSGPVKIGWSKRPSERLKLMHWGSPVELEFIDIRRAQERVERDLHRRLKRYRLRGEWYDLPPEILIDVIVELQDKAPLPWSPAREAAELTA
jgi:hypothetical protein